MIIIYTYGTPDEKYNSSTFTSFKTPMLAGDWWLFNVAASHFTCPLRRQSGAGDNNDSSPRSLSQTHAFLNHCFCQLSRRADRMDGTDSILPVTEATTCFTFLLHLSGYLISLLLRQISRRRRWDILTKQQENCQTFWRFILSLFIDAAFALVKEVQCEMTDKIHTFINIYFTSSVDEMIYKDY